MRIDDECKGLILEGCLAVVVFVALIVMLPSWNRAECLRWFRIACVYYLYGCATCEKSVLTVIIR